VGFLLRVHDARHWRSGWDTEKPEEACDKDSPVHACSAQQCGEAITLSGIVTDINGRMIRNSPCTGEAKDFWVL